MHLAKSTPQSAEEPPCLLSAAEIICGRRATRSAAPDTCHALLHLYVTVCLCEAGYCEHGSLFGNHHCLGCAWKLVQQPPRAVVSYLAPISYRAQTVRVPTMIPIPVRYSLGARY